MKFNSNGSTRFDGIVSNSNTCNDGLALDSAAQDLTMSEINHSDGGGARRPE